MTKHLHVSLVHCHDVLSIALILLTANLHLCVRYMAIYTEHATFTVNARS